MKPQKSFRKVYFVVVVLVLLTGISVGGFLVLKSGVGYASISEQLSQILDKNKSPISGCQPNPSNKNSDADNDGLMDWQEEVYQADSCRPDSDGDGYLDGEEVLSGYNPTIAAPNDATESAQDRGLPQNLTDALAENVAKQIVEGKLGNISDALDPTAIETSNQVVNDAISQTISRAMNEFSLPDIDDSEIIISSDNGDSAIRLYAREISQIINRNRQEFLSQGINKYELEVEILAEAIQKSDFSQIDKYIQFYERIAQDIQKTPVPSKLKEIHKEQIGIFEVLAGIYRAIEEINQDPVKSIIALEQYQKVFQLTQEMFQKLSNLLN